MVEKDVYITKAELMKCIWENGYSENEMNAFEFAFPADYKFHYPGGQLQTLAKLSLQSFNSCCGQLPASQLASPGLLRDLQVRSGGLAGCLCRAGRLV